MPEVALAAYVLYLLLAFGLRTILQRRRTGNSGFNGISGTVGSAEWSAGVLFVVAFVLGGLAPILAITDALDPIGVLDTDAVHFAGLFLFALGLVGTLAAQGAMGESWRIGVDANDRTELVTTGVFGLVRNPIFSAMMPASAGLALLVPSVVAIVGVFSLLVALELQVRVVEEPYLRRTHADRYVAYARNVGRFIPGVGRLV